MKLIADNVLSHLVNLMGMCFVGNRIADRCKSQLVVKFGMINTSYIVHEHFAHDMPMLADYIGEYCEQRNCDTIYPITPKDDTNYQTTEEIFERLFNFMVDLEKQTIKTISVAQSANDIMTEATLKQFLLKLRDYTNLVSKLYNYVKINGCTPKDNLDMDNNIKSYLSLD